MKIYQNHNARDQFEIVSIEAEQTIDKGQMFYYVSCVYLKNWVAEDSEGTKQSTSTIVNKTEELTLSHLIPFFNEQISTINKLSSRSPRT